MADMAPLDEILHLVELAGFSVRSAYGLGPTFLTIPIVNDRSILVTCDVDGWGAVLEVAEADQVGLVDGPAHPDARAEDVAAWIVTLARNPEGGIA